MKLREVIEELVSAYGLREGISSCEYECIRHNFLLGEYGQCIKRIKKFLKLSMVEVRILYVNNEEMMASLTDEEREGLKAVNDAGKLSTSVTKQQWVSMRILIPRNIPLYGSKEFRGFSTILLINKDCLNNSFDHFLVDATHEMMHILLYATRNRWQHSEKVVDMLLMLQGFMEANERIHADGTYRSYLSPEEVRGVCWYLRERNR